MQQLDLEDLAPRDRFDAWTAVTSPFFAVSRLGSSDFRCRMSAAHWDGALLIETDVSAQRYEHTVRHAKNGGWDQIAFQMYRRGSYRGIYGETEVDVASGDISVIDLGKPYVKESTDEADLNLIVPRSTVERHCRRCGTAWC